MSTVLKPDIPKVLLMNLVKVLSFVFLIVIFVSIIQFSVGLEVFNEVFAVFGFTLNAEQIFFWTTLTVTVLALAYIFYILLTVLNVRYEFYDNKLTYYKPILFVFKKSKDISYHNISNVNYLKKGFFDGLFNTGTVTLDLSAIGESHLQMGYITKPQEGAAQINEILRAYKLKEQAEYTEKHKIDHMLRKGGL